MRLARLRHEPATVHVEQDHVGLFGHLAVAGLGEAVGQRLLFIEWHKDIINTVTSA